MKTREAAPQIKILRIDDFESAIKSREQSGARVKHPHLCIYKIVSKKAVTYYRRYIDGAIAHEAEAEIEKWLLRNMRDDENLMIDQVDLA